MSQGDQVATRPKRRLRRRPAAALLFVAVLVLLWLAWWRVAAHRLAQATAAMAAAGAPIEPPDTPRPPLPPEQNAATYYQQAIAAMSPTAISPSISGFPFNEYPPFPPAWIHFADASVAANGPILAIARKAQGLDQADWKYTIAYGSYTPAYSNALQQSRKLAYVLADAAVNAHLHDDDAEAIERLQDAIHLAAMLSERCDLMGRLVSIGLESLALTRLELITPDLRISDSDSSSATQPPGTVTRATLRRLIKTLLNEQDAHRTAREDFIATMRAEVQSAQELRGNTFLLRPMLKLELARIFRTRRGELLAMEQQDWPTAETLLLPEPSDRATNSSKNTDPPRYSRVVSETYGSPLSRYVEAQFRAIAERRVAATAIAIQLYREDHHRWSQSLDELVPAYLPSVPLDPFLPGKSPMQYVILRGSLPDGGDRPMLRFDWSNRRDSGSPPPEPTFGYSRGWQWRDLSRWYPPVPATAPGEE